MWPLIRDFFTRKSAAVRGLRLFCVALGAAITQGMVLPEGWEWLGYIALVVGPLLTDQRPNDVPRGTSGGDDG